MSIFSLDFCLQSKLKSDVFLEKKSFHLNNNISRALLFDYFFKLKT